MKLFDLKFIMVYLYYSFFLFVEVLIMLVQSYVLTFIRWRREHVLKTDYSNTKSSEWE